MTPGTHPQQVSRVTITIDPHPRSMTASGGHKMAKSTLISDISISIFKFDLYCYHLTLILVIVPSLLVNIHSLLLSGNGVFRIELPIL